MIERTHWHTRIRQALARSRVVALIGPATFLLLGSASPLLLRQSSESLAGRIEVIEIGGFGFAEVGFSATDTLWLRGGFPLAFLAGRRGRFAARGG